MWWIMFLLTEVVLYFDFRVENSLDGIVANMLECNIIVSSNASYIMFIFGLIFLGKVWTSLSPQLCCPVRWGCRIQQLLLCRAVRLPTSHANECPRYDTKQSNAEVPLILELWGMRSTPSLPLLPGPLLSGVVVPDTVLFIGQIGIAWKGTVFVC